VAVVRHGRIEARKSRLFTPIIGHPHFGSMGTNTHFGWSSEAMISTGRLLGMMTPEERIESRGSSARYCQAHAETAGAIKKSMAKRGLICDWRGLMEPIFSNFSK